MKSEEHERLQRYYEFMGKKFGYKTAIEYRIPDSYDCIDIVWEAKSSGIFVERVFIEVELNNWSAQVWKNMTKGLFLKPTKILFVCGNREIYQAVIDASKRLDFNGTFEAKCLDKEAFITKVNFKPILATIYKPLSELSEEGEKDIPLIQFKEEIDKVFAAGATEEKIDEVYKRFVRDKNFKSKVIQEMMVEIPDFKYNSSDWYPRDEYINSI